MIWVANESLVMTPVICPVLAFVFLGEKSVFI